MPPNAAPSGDDQTLEYQVNAAGPGGGAPLAAVATLAFAIPPSTRLNIPPTGPAQTLSFDLEQ